VRQGSVAVLVFAAGCDGPQNMLAARGPQAASIAELWWVMLGLATIVSLLVIGMLLVAVRRGRARHRDESVAEVNETLMVWVGGVIGPAIILFGVLVKSLQVAPAIYPSPGEPPPAITVEVTGKQFWWEVRYPESGIVTANEITIPVGQPVRFLVSSPDVIHSFWIPQLQGKIDMIPGRVTEIRMQADEVGAFRGQCAEFCGMGHALMAFWVIALPPGEFAAWLARRQLPRPEPAEAEVGRGREVFFASGCGHCHATRGAPLPPALGGVGPDLSDLATRRTLAAGTLPNTRGALGDWISNPQRIKPGSLMPPTQLPSHELEALLTYLESLR